MHINIVAHVQKQQCFWELLFLGGGEVGGRGLRENYINKMRE